MTKETAPEAVRGAISAPREILVVKPSSLGDVVHALPAVARLKAQWPQARLSWLVNPEWAPLLQGNPCVDEVVLFPRGEFRGLRGIPRIFPWAQKLRRTIHADLVLDLQCLLRSALISRLCRTAGGTAIGLSDAREGSRLFYDRLAQVNPDAHAVDRYLAGATAAGAESNVRELQWPLPAGTPPQGEIPPRFVLLHPFSRGEGKSLSPEDVLAFCQALAPFPVVVAGKADASLPASLNVLNLLNRTSIPELIWLIRRSSYVVSVDSGPMHIAAAITQNLVAIHTWSDPRKVGPYPGGAWVLKDGRLQTAQDYRSGTQGDPIGGMSELGAWLIPKLQ